ncbi:MAG: FAD-dependent oxidoreductase [Pirellulales bacterium]|nr:FAD-dependent oxidoreductase [Pirellulales bacterium]
MITRSIFTAFSVLVLCAARLSGAHVVWVEAEQFADRGGWADDTQFIDQMGSPYLLAVGLGKPVADAVTKVAIPSPGKYRLWTRTRDWIPEHHPGRFQIVLIGRAGGRTFGESGKPGWQWEDGGVHQIAGSVELRLRDLTGYYGRCDVVVLTDDLEWTPPADQAAVAAIRQQHGGVSPDVKDMGDCDVVVIGGGLAGCVAAVAAARLGTQAVLLENRPVLGGNASVEILVPPVGVWPYGKQDPLDPKESGIVEEFRGKGIQTLQEVKPYSGRLMRLVAAEPKLRLCLNTHATGVEMKLPGTIGAVLATDTRNGRRMRFGGKVFVDCTGDGTVGVAAGAEYRHGREPRSMYNESMAPEAGDKQTMGNSLKYASFPAKSPQPFEPPPWAMRFPTCDSFPPGRHPILSADIQWQWKIELGGTRDTYRGAEEIRDELLRLIYGMWDHVKNHCGQLGEKAANHRLAWVEHIAGKRESMRLIGDYVLAQNDIAGQTVFPDRVAYGGWGVDDHWPGGFFHWGEPAQHDYKGVLHSIPLRSLYSKNVDNLLMAGRNVSASHVAMSATRVMLTCAVMGQAAGTAAACCVEHEVSPRSLCYKHLEQLQQQLLKDGAYLIALPNEDPRDLARSAHATASSERALPAGETMSAANVINGYARAADGKTNAWSPAAGRPLPQWLELAWSKPQAFNVVHVTFQTNDRAPRRFALEARQESSWQRVAEVSENRHRRHVLGLERTSASHLRVVVLEPGREEAGVCEIRVYDEPQEVVEAARRRARTMNLPDDGPGLPWDDSVVWVTGVDPRKLPGIVVDSSQAETTGAWANSDYTKPFIGEGYLHDLNADKGTKSIRFAIKVEKEGTYELRLAYSPFGNRATNVPVTVETPAGAKTIHVNQREKPPIDGLFFPLGQYELDAGGTVSVRITTEETDGFVTADAVQAVGL